MNDEYLKYILRPLQYGLNGSSYDLHEIGHYTQLVWDATHRVGCGVQRCHMAAGTKRQEYFLYVCNYCPM